MLFRLARDPEKNRDLLFDLLKPKDLIPQDKNVWKKFPPKLLELAQKPDFVEPEPWISVLDEKIPIDNILEKEPEKETPFIENKPEKPVILEVKDIKPLPPSQRTRQIYRVGYSNAVKPFPNNCNFSSMRTVPANQILQNPRVLISNPRLASNN